MSEPTIEVGCTLPGPTVSPALATLHPGDTLRAIARETSCSGVTSVLPVRWNSSDTSVATVGANDGSVRAVARGTASIIASAVQDPNVKGAMALTVVP